MIKVAISGARGRMGSEVVRAVTEAEGMEVSVSIEFGDDMGALLRESQPAVMVDFTVPSSAMTNIRMALENKVKESFFEKVKLN